MTDKKDIFISYSSANKDKADYICEKLEERGLKCWIAPRDIKRSSNYAEEIMLGLKEVDLVLLVFSKNAHQSIYVTEEIENAFKFKKAILTFKLDETIPEAIPEDKMGFFLKNKQWLDTCPNGIFEEEGVTKFDDYSDAKKDEFYNTLFDDAIHICDEVRQGKYSPPEKGEKTMPIKLTQPVDDESFLSKYKFAIVALVIILIAVVGFVAMNGSGNDSSTSKVTNLTIDYVGLESDGQSYFVYGSIPSDLNDTSKYKVQTKFYDSSNKVLETNESKLSDIDGNTLCQVLISDGNVSKVTIDILDDANKVIYSAESKNIINQ
jgi:hypothetical protein